MNKSSKNNCKKEIKKNYIATMIDYLGYDIQSIGKNYKTQETFYCTLEEIEKLKDAGAIIDFKEKKKK